MDKLETGRPPREDITFPDDLAFDSADGFSELIYPCTDLACKFLPTLFPNAISLLPALGILLFLRGEPGRSAEEERTEDGG